jgi:hypothetical protein
MANNKVNIVMHPNVFEVVPSQAEVDVGAGEQLEVTVDWTDNQNAWTAVAVEAFRVEGLVLETSGEPARFKGPGDTHKNVGFQWPDGQLGALTVKYQIVFDRADPEETFILDPQVILRP